MGEQKYEIENVAKTGIILVQHSSIENRCVEALHEGAAKGRVQVLGLSH